MAKMDHITLGQLQGVATVTDKTGAVIQTLENLSLTLVEGPTAQIECSLGMTLNLGNFQSAKLSVGITAPSNIDPDSLDTTFEYLKKWVDAKLSVMVKEAKEQIA